MLCLQGGTIKDEEIYAVDIADDGTVVLAGDCRGDWAATSAGGDDFVAMKLSADGVEQWRWQVRLCSTVISGGEAYFGRSEFQAPSSLKIRTRTRLWL